MKPRVIDTDARDEQEEERWIDSESDEEAWDDEGRDELPPRPRGRLLRPLPLALIAVALAAAGFIGGVEAQKGSEGGAAGAAGLGAAGGLPSFASQAAEAGEGSSGESGAKEAGSEAAGEGTAASGTPSFAGSEAAATGTVTSVEGHTIYVKESDGTTVEVKVGDGATVTRDSNVSAKKVHPGDTVVVEGAKKGSTVTASSVAATESGVESTTGFGALGAAAATGESSGSEEETSVESLFEE